MHVVVQQSAFGSDFRFLLEKENIFCIAPISYLQWSHMALSINMESSYLI